ncbi:MAG: DUF721 domain-containing protein [Coriobacteriales bacterium]|jgi:hypothetical protein|nr:DUF721 domain-containing protein [Coriobacteriales bacterium]
MSIQKTTRKRASVFLGDEIGEYLGGLKVSVGAKADSGTGDKTRKSTAARAAKNPLNLLACWQQTAPARLLAHTDNVVYSTQSKETELLVYVDSAVYAAELSMDKELYRIRMQQELHKEIGDIKFLVSRKTALREKRV